MTAQFARAPHVSGRPAAPVHNAPHAALLIDFDNVTMGIRSDLTKELKSLLNSDIVKGKVAVQRAYADWRRYPQYIVPLAENSVDLIFAPAYGSSKKNATDIRLSIDALELVFTRPEIGTFILLSGDSDFSSLVLKLKEYGKYVIGIGIRESASDLLVQNCDEYYSYSALTGLTKAGDEETKQWDPWECAEIAVQRMADQGDVMRSDRLKQVMLELDPNFDEKALGFTKFNRFIQEAANRGLLELNKLENGQFEVAPIGEETAPKSAAEIDASVDETEAARTPRAREEGRPSRRDRQRDRHRDRDRDRDAQSEPAPAPVGTAPAEPAPAPVRSAPAKPAPESVPAPAPTPAPAPASSLKEAYDLLRRAVKDVTNGKGTSARDSDVKRRILEMNPDWSEPALGFSKFSRFLRQAHDAEVINLRKLENGNYEITLPGSAADTAESASGGGRGRGRGRGTKSGRSPRESGRGRREQQEQLDLAEAASTTAEASAPRPSAPAKPAPTKPAPESVPAPKPAPAPAATAPSQGRLYRSGSRGRAGIQSGPPPLLPGQTLGTAKAPEVKPEVKKPEPAKVDNTVVIARLMSYKGVGQKTAEAAIEEFGADNVFSVLQSEPDRVTAKLGARRAQPLIDGFAAEQAKHTRNGARKTARKSGSSKNGRSRGGAKRGRSRSGTPKS